MSSDDPTLWEAPPHTLAKNRLYQAYLERWIPILGLSGFQHLTIVDGFAGPGQYVGGEDGSPVVPDQSILNHSSLGSILEKGVSIRLLCIEERQDRFEHLRTELRQLAKRNGVNLEALLGSFEPIWRAEMSQLEDSGAPIGPVLLFVDPFGPSGYPMELVAKLASHATTEVLINFAWQPLNRWLISQPGMHPTVDALYGNTGWRPGLQIRSLQKRSASLLVGIRRHLRLLDGSVLGSSW